MAMDVSIMYQPRASKAVSGDISCVFLLKTATDGNNKKDGRFYRPFYYDSLKLLM
jgi:hypothetical protein